MNPFYSYSHNHITQFSGNQNEIPSPSITPHSINSHQNQLQQGQPQHMHQQSPQSQFLQSPQSQSSAASVVAAAASFYARNGGQDYTTRRHMQSMQNSPLGGPPGVNSITANSTAVSLILNKFFLLFIYSLGLNLFHLIVSKCLIFFTV